jgi:hypothetical protein
MQRLAVVTGEAKKDGVHPTGYQAGPKQAEIGRS